jgi:hypothetical protein
MSLEILGNNNYQEYDDLVDISPEGTIFHKTWWLNIFKEYYGSSYDVKFYGFFENKKLTAGMPVPVNKKCGLNFIYNPKFTVYLGSFFTESKAKTCTKVSHRKKINQIFGDILKESGLLLRYSFHNSHIDLQPFIWSGFDLKVHFYTQVLNLTDMNKVWQSLDGNKRNEINSALKQNYRITFGNFDELYKLYKNSMINQSHSFVKKEMLENIFKECKKHNCCEVFTLFNENEAIASFFIVWDNKRSYCIAAGMDTEHRGAMSLLVWEVIKYTKEQLNLDEIDFAASSVPSIEHAYRGYGGDPKPIFILRTTSTAGLIVLKSYDRLKNSIST